MHGCSAESALISIGLEGGDPSLKWVGTPSTIEGIDLDRFRDDFETKKRQNHGQKETSNKKRLQHQLITIGRNTKERRVWYTEVAVKLTGSNTWISGE